MDGLKRLYGAVLEKGPQNWQIIQQRNNRADILLSGKLYAEDINGSEKVFARVVDENSGSVVIPYSEGQKKDNRNWSIKLKDVPAGGPYRIELCMRRFNPEGSFGEIRGDMIRHIGVGDLYVIAGQSNAVGYGKDYVYDPTEMGIHMFKSDGTWDIASHPLGDATNTLHPVSRDLCNPAHSPFLNFARIVRQKIKYPIGLIPTAKGGTALSHWNKSEDGHLYRNMLDIIKMAGGRIKGVLWYQGCNDAEIEGLSGTYFERFKSMVADMRKDLRHKRLPVLTVQLNKIKLNKSNKEGWGIVREAQRQAAMLLPDVYVVPSVDLNVCDGIHNSASANMVIGERLAKVALKHIYGFNLLCDAPNAVRAFASGSREITIEFENVYGPLNCDLAQLEQFPVTVTDSLGRLNVAKYCSIENKMVLQLERGLGDYPFASYASESNPAGTLLYDTASRLPLLPFYRLKIDK